MALIGFHLLRQYKKKQLRINKEVLYYIASGLSRIKSSRDIEYLVLKSSKPKRWLYTSDNLPDDAKNHFNEIKHKIPKNLHGSPILVTN